LLFFAVGAVGIAGVSGFKVSEERIVLDMLQEYSSDLD
jgi:hypothetical protein